MLKKQVKLKSIEKSINSLNEENSHQLDKKHLRIWEEDRLSSGNY